MNTRMVVNNAGIAAASIVHQGFFPSGGISQPRDSAFVGWKTVGMLSLGVPTLRAASTPTMIITDIITAKSDTTLRTWIKEQHVSVIFVIDHSSYYRISLSVFHNKLGGGQPQMFDDHAARDLATRQRTFKITLMAVSLFEVDPHSKVWRHMNPHYTLAIYQSTTEFSTSGEFGTHPPEFTLWMTESLNDWCEFSPLITILQSFFCTKNYISRMHIRRFSCSGVQFFMDEWQKISNVFDIWFTCYEWRKFRKCCPHMLEDILSIKVAATSVLLCGEFN